MKKIIRRTVLCILAVIIVGVSALAAYLFKPEPPTEVKRPTVTDVQGNAYLASVDDKTGETYAAVTDGNGNVWAAEIKADGTVGSTVKSLNGKVDKQDIPKNYTGPKIDESASVNAYTGTASVVSQGETTAQSTSNGVAPSTQPNAPSVHRIKKYQDMFNSGTYFMEFTTNDEELSQEPVMAAAKNGNIMVQANVSGFKCRMLYRADKDTTYVLLDNFRKYSKMPDAIMGDDMDMSSLNMGKNFAVGVKDSDITVSKVQLDGKELNCESYTTENGKLMKYYFDGDVMVRLDCIDKKGECVSTFISKLTSEVPDSTFEIPKNYGYLNLSWLDMK